MSSEVAIRLSGVGKAYRMYDRPEDRFKQMLLGRFGVRYGREHWAIQDIDLEVPKGSTVGILGRNGAGKSTLLQLVCGMLEPTRGTVEIKGRAAALIELGAGFNPEFTGRENVRLAASVLGLGSSEIEERLPAILEFAAIGEFIDQPVKLYSSGMYARLAFAVAAHVDAELLIVDEILSVGDAAFNQKCMRFVRKFKENGTLLFVSHDTAAITALCDEAIWLDRGVIRERGPAREVCHNYLAAISREGDQRKEFQTATLKSVPATSDIRKDRLEQVGADSRLAIGPLDPDAPWFGTGDAELLDIGFYDENGQRLAEMHGGQVIEIRLRYSTTINIEQALVGFQIRDERGQVVFGENTHLAYGNAPYSVLAGTTFEACFELELPYLPQGVYSLVAALSEGTQTENVHHLWIDDALFFTVESSHVGKGVVGLPLHQVEFETD
ncbi:ABC transporter ATP-binding protein [Microvirga flavescens]|uniref:ABC transporter ATP-binding protein n=1 Tax=Microvirga flavescens TaxID=2249811 RepID=UPI000DDB0435|nr:ABC transporter ATP-binding protein [Microvirga flavescens]